MKKVCLLVIVHIAFFVSCKKDVNTSNNAGAGKQLYPLGAANKWTYIDTFFDAYGDYYGFDTFYLRATDTMFYNGTGYTVITDQFGDHVFTVRSDDSSAYILEPKGEALMLSLPMPAGNDTSINNSFQDGTLNSKIYTTVVTTTNYPSYKILITQDDGVLSDYKQDELYLAAGIGIIKGYTRWKNAAGDIYTSDSYIMLAHGTH
jgi:hypothetical protein